MKKILIPAVALFISVSAFGQKKKTPNVLFLLVDDMQRSAIHAYGNSQVASPNIDGLVADGISFMHTYTNGALGGALSMPSRAMLMTGRGIFQLVSDGQTIPVEHTTLPEQLRANGYRTFATGKWHSDRQSFNRSFAEGDNIFFSGMHQYTTGGHTAPRLRHYDPTGEYAERPFVGEKFSSEMYADAAVEFLKKKKKEPFFAYVAFTSPHDPRNQHPAYGQTYDSTTINLPVNYLPQHPFDNGDLAVRDEVYLPTPRLEEAVKKELADYYGMINEVDVQIGRILQTLKESGEADNTIIIFASDNGLAVGQHGLLGKQNLYEHSISVPLVINAPGYENKKGRSTDANCYLYDIYPTLCELIGMEAAPSVTGKSLVPVMKGTAYHRDQLFLAYSSVQRALVKDGWKYIVYNVGGHRTEQLFDLSNDPREMVNHAGDPAYAFKIAGYRRILKEEMKKNDDFCDLDDFYWWEKGKLIPWNDAINLYTKP